MLGVTAASASTNYTQLHDSPSRLPLQTTAAKNPAQGNENGKRPEGPTPQGGASISVPKLQEYRDRKHGQVESHHQVVELW